MSETTAPDGSLRRRLHALYYGNDVTAQRFRYALLGFDIVTIIFFIASSLVEPALWFYALDYFIAAVLLADYVARMLVANSAWRSALRFTSIADALVILSLLMPAFTDNLGFLRVARMLRLMRSYHLLRELRRDWLWFRRNEEVIQSGINLFVFVFVITAIVYVVEGSRNPAINNYFDALYFTVTTLTTTGFGDITMQDTVGRVLAVVIMVVGVGLFLRLVQSIFRPVKVNFPCPDCGLQRHEPDAVHCKHCGRVLNIPSDGEAF
ncbi:potassium channel family protein [Desertibaculum subflavum]|uniref:potassium channel family protein n=1 Tax=Desertibaculum subflavum TaxID=2268458 RepID=UPI000E66955C